MLSCLTLVVYLEGQNDAVNGFIGFVVLIGILAALVISNNQKIKEIRQAKANYQDSLAQLKSNPTNASLRQQTLELGRYYSNLTRKKKGVTIFDEMALMNDINAACAGATTVHQTSPPHSSSPSIEKRLARLSELRSKGLIDEQEYSSRRQRIIEEL
jgi:hypothetical protein